MDNESCLTRIDADSDRGQYRLHNVAVRLVADGKPTLICFNEESSVPTLLSKDRGIQTWISIEAAKPCEAINCVSVDSTEPVQLIVPIANPAHSLNDALFSLCIDMPAHGPDDSAVIDQYFLAAPVKPDNSYAINNWNFYVHLRAGFIRSTDDVLGNTGRREGTFFFPHLVMPKFMRHRFAADWQSLAPFPTMPIIEQSKGMYPPGALENLYERLGPSALPTIRKPIEGKPSLLIYDRGDADRRRWENAAEAVRMVRREFSGCFSSVRFMRGEYAQLNAPEQAKLFRAADLIITPHGGALANMIFCKPGTTLIELTDVVDPWGWFHFCARLGMRHILHKPVSLTEHDQPRFSLSTNELYDLIADALGDGYPTSPYVFD